MSKPLIPVILAGGKGERFWPLSRTHRPKQFLSLDGSGKSLLQATADRLCDLSQGWEKLWVITASHLAAGVREQLPELPEANLLVEPEGRDTAPAFTWATLEIAQRYGDSAIIGMFPADHWIAQPAIFQETLDGAVTLADRQSVIVTLGITPTYASTGYGYIQAGEVIGEFAGLPAYRVTRFTEKPDRETAEAFVASGEYSWNGGMFIYRAGVALTELQQHAPEILEPLKQRGVAAYSEVPKKSIDYALMEKTRQCCVLPVRFGWDDMGDWNAIERLLKGDQQNVALAQHVGLDTQDTILYASDSQEVIVTLGVEDLVVVRDGNVTLIARKDRTQEIKQVLQRIKSDPQLNSLL